MQINSVLEISLSFDRCGTGGLELESNSSAVTSGISWIRISIIKPDIDVESLMA